MCGWLGCLLDSTFAGWSFVSWIQRLLYFSWCVCVCCVCCVCVCLFCVCVCLCESVIKGVRSVWIQQRLEIKRCSRCMAYGREALEKSVVFVTKMSGLKDVWYKSPIAYLLLHRTIAAFRCTLKHCNCTCVLLILFTATPYTAHLQDHIKHFFYSIVFSAFGISGV